MRALFFSLLLLIAPLTQAEPAPSIDNNEPEITIRHDDKKAYYEYRVNGELKEIKVVPKGGVPYYLVPAGPGEEFIRAESSQLLIPKWVLFRW